MIKDIRYSIRKGDSWYTFYHPHYLSLRSSSPPNFKGADLGLRLCYRRRI